MPISDLMQNTKCLIQKTFNIKKDTKSDSIEYSFNEYNCEIVRNAEEIFAFKNKNRQISNFCSKINKKASNSFKKKGKITGYCSVCNKKTNFVWEIIPQYASHIVFSDIFHCSECNMFNRVRAIIHIFKIFEKEPVGKKLFCYEKTTQFYKNFAKLYSEHNTVIGSEYFGQDKISGEYINGIRHEDAMKLSFSDNELDYMFANDVFEHVSDINLALKEALRCLKKGGRLIFHVPLELNLQQTIERAGIENGEIVYYMEKEYHYGGFPNIDSNGCLVFYSFGCDLFDIIKGIGFSDTYAIAIQDKKFVNIGVDPLLLFVCEK